MKYFAYGSNMLEERLKSPKRVPNAVFQSTGYIRGYTLRFHKRSADGSGKCNIVKSASANDLVYGVVFEVPKDRLEALDNAEGKGQGYHHDCNILVRLADGIEHSTLAYVADSDAIDDNLIPYVWYHRLVIAGAEQHRLPEQYLAGLRKVQSLEDPCINRPNKREAEESLKAYYDELHA